MVPGSPFKQCPNCGIGNQPQSPACQQCGAPLAVAVVRPDRRKVSLALLIAGGVIAFYFQFLYSITFPGSNVVNMGLMNDRTTGTVFGGLMAIVGAVLYATNPQSPSSPSPVVPQAPPAPRPPLSFPAETMWIPALALTLIVMLGGSLVIVRLINAGYASKAPSSPSTLSLFDHARSLKIGQDRASAMAEMGANADCAEGSEWQGLYPSCQWTDDSQLVLVQYQKDRVKSVTCRQRDEADQWQPVRP